MANKKRQRVHEMDISGVKYFDTLALLLARLHEAGRQPHGSTSISIACWLR